MYVKHTPGPDVEMETIDGIIVPKFLVAEAQTLATRERKVHFVGAMCERNKEFVETDETRYTFQAGRIKESGIFILGDNHDFVASFKGDAGEFIGGIVWVTPEKPNVACRPVANQNFVNPFEGSNGVKDLAWMDSPIVDHIECACCTRPIPIYGKAGEGRFTDPSQVRIERGNFQMADDERGFFDSEGRNDDNVKFDRFICSRCYNTDPDLCAFFNKIGLRIR